MYELGSIVRGTCNDYLTYMYKGKYYCCALNNVGGSDDYSHSEKTLEDIKTTCQAPDDCKTKLRCLGVIEGKPRHGDIYNKMLLCTKKKGKLVWVSLRSLKTHDLNELLHINGNYYKPGDENKMFRYKVVEDYD